MKKINYLINCGDIIMIIKKFTIFSIAISLFMSLAIFDFGYAQREITSSIEEIVVTAQKEKKIFKMYLLLLVLWMQQH